MNAPVPEHSTNGHSAVEESSWGDFNLLAIAWRRKWLLVVGVLMGIALGYLYYAQLTPKYASTSQLFVNQKQSRAPISGDRYTDMSVNQSPYQMQWILPTHVALIRSPTVIEAAVEKHKLDQLPSLRKSPNPAGQIISGLQVNIGTSDAKWASILNVSYRSTDSRDCQRVVYAVVDAYIDFLSKQHQNVSQETVELIREAKDVLTKRLKEKEEEYRAFQEQNPFIAESSVDLSPLSAISDEQSSVLVQEVQTRTRLETIQEALAAGVPRRVLASIAQRLARSQIELHSLSNTEKDWKEKLLPLMVTREIALQKYGKEHPRVKEIDSQIAILTDYYSSRESVNESERPEPTEEEGGDFVDIYLVSLQQELREIERRKEEYSKLASKFREEVKGIQLLKVRDQAYRREIARIESLFNSVVERLQEIDLVKEFGGYDVQVLKKPAVGAYVEPRLWSVLPMAAVLGLIGGCGLALLVDMADKSYRSPEQIQSLLGVPVVAHIPVLPALGPRESAEPNLDNSLLSYHKSRSVEAEAYRRVRTSIYFATPGQHKAIQVTSPEAGDGKTTLSANLAITIATSGKKVLLLDADMRRPRVHAVFGVQAAVGLSTVLASKVEVDRAIQHSVVENLDLLPCGPKPKNPAELLVSHNFAQLIGQLREKYDFVIVDTPPVLAVSDAAVVSALADGVLLTMRISRKSRPLSERSVSQLKSVGAKILGVVVNGAGPRPGYAKYQYGYANYEYARYPSYSYRDAESYADYTGGYLGEEAES